jgi:hypothetical protein
MTTNRERAEALLDRSWLDATEADCMRVEGALDAAELRGFERGRAEERAAVVKWLRRDDDELEAESPRRLARRIEDAAHLPAKETP